MASISSLGIGSGLDLNSLLNQLVAAERAPADNRLNKKEADLQAKFSTFGTVQSAVSEIQTKAKALADLTQARSATVSDTSILSATADATAGTGLFNITVSTLAAAQSLASNAFTASTDVVNTGTITVSLADSSSFQVTIDSTNNTVSGIKDAINSAAGGVDAALVTDASGVRLTLTTSSTGTSKAITNIAISGDGDGNDTDNSGLSQLSFDVAGGPTPPSFLTESQLASDAALSVNGLSISSASNTLSNVIEGLTLTLKQTTGATPATVTVAASTAGATAAVNDFVGSFNSFIDLVDQSASFDASTGVAGILLGDSTLRSVSDRLRNAIFDDFNSGDVNFQRLSDVGISVGSDGKLSVDSTVLSDALNDNFNASLAVLNQAGSSIEALAKAFTDSDGILDSRIDSLQSQITSIGDDRAALDRRIGLFQDRLQRQFANLDQLLSQLNQQGDFLLGQLQSIPLPGSNNTNKS